MFIEEIIIDGFKSYATRTVISGFDKQFNAITGLNGSGKSNILDAICFVLGISNLTQVRKCQFTISYISMAILVCCCVARNPKKKK
jgi:chromosome segregation ATPase